MAARPEGRSLVCEFPGTQHNKRQHGNQKELETEKNVLLKVWHCIKWLNMIHDSTWLMFGTWQHMTTQNPPFPGLNLTALCPSGHDSSIKHRLSRLAFPAICQNVKRWNDLKWLEPVGHSRTSCLYQIDQYWSWFCIFNYRSQSKWTRNGMLSSLSEFHEIEYALNWCDYWIGSLVPTKWRQLWTLDQVLTALTTAKCK